MPPPARWTPVERRARRRISGTAAGETATISSGSRNAIRASSGAERPEPAEVRAPLLAVPDLVPGDDEAAAPQQRHQLEREDLRIRDGVRLDHVEAGRPSRRSAANENTMLCRSDRRPFRYSSRSPHRARNRTPSASWLARARPTTASCRRSRPRGRRAAARSRGSGSPSRPGSRGRWSPRRARRRCGRGRSRAGSGAGDPGADAGRRVRLDAGADEHPGRAGRAVRPGRAPAPSAARRSRGGARRSARDR